MILLIRELDLKLKLIKNSVYVGFKLYQRPWLKIYFNNIAIPISDKIRCQQTLVLHTKRELGKYQAEFRRGRSTIDQIFTVTI